MLEFKNPYQPSDLPDDQSQTHVAKAKPPIPAIVLTVLCSISIVLNIITLAGFGLLALRSVPLEMKDMLPFAWSAFHASLWGPLFFLFESLGFNKNHTR